MYSYTFRALRILTTPLVAAGLVALVSVTTPGVAYARQGAVSPVTGVAIPKGATPVSDPAITSGLGRLIAAGAVDFKLPPRPGGPGSAEVYTWSGAAYKPGRAPFMQTLLQSALTQAGYVVTNVDSSSENTPNTFDEEAYGTGWMKPWPADPRAVFFHATNAKKGDTIIGVWFDQASQNRVILVLGKAGFAGAPAETKVPEVSDPNVWLVKDLKDATKGMPSAPIPTFPKIAAKPKMVRGMIKDGAGKPIAGAQLVAWTSAAGGFRTSTRGKSNAQGVYELLLPIGISQIVNADCRVNHNGKSMLLPLHPVDGELDQFDAKAGHVENFVLRTSGSAGPDGGNYGAGMRLLTYKAPAKSIVEVRMKPIGTLLDGSTGKTLVFRYPIKTTLPETFFAGIPLGRYELTAQLYDGEDALPLRVRKTFRDEGEDDPVPANSLTVVFQDNGGELASLGRSGVRQFEVTLEP
jgi:hypothetical protein